MICMHAPDCMELYARRNVIIAEPRKFSLFTIEPI